MLLAIAVLAQPAPAEAAPTPVFNVTQLARPTHLVPGGTGKIVFDVDNLGPVPTSGTITATMTLPQGVTVNSFEQNGNYWNCAVVVGATSLTCTLVVGNQGGGGGPDIAAYGSTPSAEVVVNVGSGAPEHGFSTVTVAGGGAPQSDTDTQEITVSSTPAGFGLSAFRGWASDFDGAASTQAGAHPDVTTWFELNQAGRSIAGGNLKDVTVEAPRGLIGNPNAVSTCDPALIGSTTGIVLCPADTQVGWATVTTDGLVETPVYNIAPPYGRPARFAFNVSGVVTTIDPTIRSDGDYGVRVRTDNVSQTLPIKGFKLTLWGVPADPIHDAQRVFGGAEGPQPSTLPRKPLITTPTECSGQPLRTSIRVRSWLAPRLEDEASFDTDFNGNPIVNEGCNQLEFNPSIEARPTTNLADSPAGLDVKVTVPQNEDPDGLATAQLRDTTLTFPAGMTVNPSSAQGLGACSPAQVGLTTPVGQPAVHFNEEPVTCPDASKLGTVEIDTPLLSYPLNGTVYLATQGQNPFASLLALYIVVEDPKSGVTIKLAGHPVPDPNTGQLEVSFDQNPQLPFNSLKVNLFSGPRAALKTPATCGQFTTTSSLVPWSSPEGATVNPTDTFGITNGPNNSACLKSDSEAPNSPAFNAGTTDPTAGAYSPFTLRVARADGTAPIKSIDATLPKGLLGKLAGIAYCPDASLAAAAGRSGKVEQASASCPASSRIGSVTVGAGAGSNPLYVGGNAYLAGPYKGAPLSLAIVTPAVAGPFDLGAVVVRNALYVDPETAQIHAVSDQIPTILQGIPLDIRSIVVNMDRPSFTLNPTSCDPMSVLGAATSVFNQTASLTNPFQVGGCGALGFKPALAIDLKGGTKRSEYPALRATLKARPGDANIGKAVVSLPHSEFLAQSHIKTICTRVQFAASSCPPGSIYGKARAFSPLIDKPLEGPVYLRSSSNPLPDLVADLNGQIRVSLVGRIDSVKGGIRTSFESVPDAPVSKFVLEMAGSKKGLLENSRNLCKTTNKADVKLDGQNGKFSDSTPVVTNDCKTKKHKHKKSTSHKRGSRH